MRLKSVLWQLILILRVILLLISHFAFVGGELIRPSVPLFMSLKVYHSSCSLRRQRLMWEWDAVYVRPEWLIVVVGFFHARCLVLTENKRQTVPRRERLFRARTLGNTWSVRSRIIFHGAFMAHALDMSCFKLWWTWQPKLHKTTLHMLVISHVTQLAIGNWWVHVGLMGVHVLISGVEQLHFGYFASTFRSPLTDKHSHEHQGAPIS